MVEGKLLVLFRQGRCSVNAVAVQCALYAPVRECFFMLIDKFGGIAEQQEYFCTADLSVTTCLRVYIKFAA